MKLDLKKKQILGLLRNMRKELSTLQLEERQIFAMLLEEAKKRKAETAK